jgi:hypothetical protein
LKLAPNADVYIALDQHPLYLANPRMSPSLFVKNVKTFRGGAGFTTAGSVGGRDDFATDSEKPIFDALIQEMLLTRPEIRIQRIMLFEGRYGGMGPHNGLIEFDTGPNTKIQKYYHLEGIIIGNESNDTWWLRFLDQHKPDLVIANGSLDRFHRLQSREVNSRVAAKIFEWLKQSQGALIEGRSLMLGEEKRVWEFSGRKHYPNSKTRVIANVRYSYGEEALLTRFGQTNEKPK